MFILYFLLSVCSSAQEGFSPFPRTQVAAESAQYSGEVNKSFGESSPGVGASITISTAAERLAFYLRGRGNFLSGSQTFLDGTQSITAKYQLTAIETEVGLQLFPLARKRKGLNLYLRGGGDVDYYSVTLEKGVTLTQLPRRDQGVGYGYTIGIGSELLFSAAGAATKFGFFIEVNLRTSSVSILKQNSFNTSAFIYSAGLCW